MRKLILTATAVVFLTGCAGRGLDEHEMVRDVWQSRVWEFHS